MPLDFLLGDDGLPYAVEFANVAVWPRRPELSSSRCSPKLPTRSNTLPSIRTQKPLPDAPSQPSRSGSLRRALRRFSEPLHKPIMHDDMVQTFGPTRRRMTTCSREERDEKTRNAMQALSEFSMSAQTLVESEECEEQAADGPLSAVPECPINPILEKPDAMKEPEALSIRSGGLRVTFRDEKSSLTVRSKKNDAARRVGSLTRTIADAVTAAGMVGASPRPVADPNSGEKALFRGTYGQVQTALQDAGLVVRECDEHGYDGACRVGTLLVANRDRSDNLIFTRVILYGS